MAALDSRDGVVERNIGLLMSVLEHMAHIARLTFSMPSRAFIVSSDDDGDGAGSAWISAKDTKQTTDSR